MDTLQGGDGHFTRGDGHFTRGDRHVNRGDGHFTRGTDTLQGGRTLCNGLGVRRYAKVGEWTLYKGGTDTIQGGTDTKTGGASVFSRCRDFFIKLDNFINLLIFIFHYSPSSVYII